MSRMKFVSDAGNAVFDAFSGFQKAFPACIVDPERRIVISNNIEKGKVALLGGGGSGHEPFCAGFIGQGMLAGAVAGLVFASPPTHNVLVTIRTLAEQNNNAGVLVVLINYTGDVLNFGLACEEAKAFGIKVEHVAIEDDISIMGDKVQGAGRRGMAGACVAMKIVGHLATLGKSLSELVQEFNKVMENIATLGCAVTACAVPGVGPLFEIESDQIEIGLGIHGEAGTERIQRPSVDELVEILLTRILSAMKLPPKPRVCVFLNNLGSTSYLELGIITGKIHSSLTRRNIGIDRMYYGSLLTSLDMAGFQISILNVPENTVWIDCLDSPTDAPAWPGTCMSIPGETSDAVPLIDEKNKSFDSVGPKIPPEQSKLLEKCLRAISSILIKEESRLNELDSMSGDGDAGSTLKKIADVILKELPNINLEYPATTLYQISKLCQNEMGGSSGALYGIFLTSAAKSISSSSKIDIATAWKTAIDTLSFYSKAKVGDRTMMDVIIPAYEEFNKQIKQSKDNKTALEEAVKIAKLKCEETRRMKPRLGRASYVPEEYIKDVDPGAYGVTLWLEAISNTIKL